MNRDIEFPQEDPAPTISLPVYVGRVPFRNRQRIYSYLIQEMRIWQVSCTCGWSNLHPYFVYIDMNTRMHVRNRHAGEWS